MRGEHAVLEPRTWPSLFPGWRVFVLSESPGQRLESLRVHWQDVSDSLPETLSYRFWN